MTDPITIFLAIAIIIIVMAFFVSWIFHKTIKRDRQIQKQEERHNEDLGSAVGTGIGVDKTDGEY